jgi:hypothetical protein
VHDDNKSNNGRIGQEVAMGGSVIRNGVFAELSIFVNNFMKGIIRSEQIFDLLMITLIFFYT